MSDPVQTSRLPDERLHRLHDGELTADERASVEADLDDAARLRLAAMADIGEALRNATSAQAAAAPVLDIHALWGNIERNLQPAKVLPLHRRIGRAVVRHPVWASTGMAAAAALAMVLTFAGPQSPSNGCEIDSLDVTGASVTVMHVDSVHSPGTTTVVWLQED